MEDENMRVLVKHLGHKARPVTDTIFGEQHVRPVDEFEKTGARKLSPSELSEER